MIYFESDRNIRKRNHPRVTAEEEGLHLAVKMPAEMPTSHTGAPSLES